MLSFRNKYVSGPLALVVALVVTASIALASGGVASSAPSAPAAAAPRTVAHTAQGRLVSRISGETANGRTVTGYMTPLKFTRHDGKVFVRGLIHGVEPVCRLPVLLEDDRGRSDPDPAVRPGSRRGSRL